MNHESRNMEQRSDGRTAILTFADQRSEFQIPKVEDWQNVAEKIVPLLKPGAILAVAGPLGAGKTTFIQALSQVLGAAQRPQSPTFALMRSYKLENAPASIARLVHIDAYRIEKPEEILALDLDEELSDGKSILVIEWPEKIAAWLKDKNILGLEIK